MNLQCHLYDINRHEQKQTGQLSEEQEILTAETSLVLIKGKSKPPSCWLVMKQNVHKVTGTLLQDAEERSKCSTAQSH